VHPLLPLLVTPLSPPPPPSPSPISPPPSRPLILYHYIHHPRPSPPLTSIPDEPSCSAISFSEPTTNRDVVAYPKWQFAMDKEIVVTPPSQNEMAYSLGSCQGILVEARIHKYTHTNGKML
jgi:hypothetical protein